MLQDIPSDIQQGVKRLFEKEGRSILMIFVFPVVAVLITEEN